MAITNGYATLAEFKSYKRISSTSASDDAVLEDIIETVSRHIDRRCGRQFYSATGTRYFNVPKDGGRVLYLDEDLLTITAFTNGDGDTIAATEYNLEPKNSPPYYKVVLKEASSEYWDYDTAGNSERVISIAGTWGYSTSVPDDIKTLCLELAASVHGRRSGQSMMGAAKITGAGVVITPKDISQMAADLLDAYHRISVDFD